MKKTTFTRCGVLLLTFIFLAVMIFGSRNVYASTAFTGMRSGISALQIVSEMKIGWNLGNTMDTGGSETSWGNPVTTHAMIDKIKQQGFNTLRLPTTWNNHVGGAPNYTIDAAFLNRVEEIANYAFDNNMYVIINAHHENSWARPTYADLPTVKTKLAAIWTQVANRFKNYGDYLIFETLNEPRLEGSPEEWNGGTAEGRDCVNQENLVAVNAIRATGGNNSTRFIMCPTYAAAGYQNTTDAFIVPNNDSRIIVSIHNYSPYTFAMEYPGVSTWGTSADKTSLNAEFDILYNKFVRNGRAVVIGESGTTNKNNTSVRVTHAEYFYSALRARQITGIWWDNNGSAVGGENFGLFNRSALSWYFPEVANAVIRGAGGTSNPTPTPIRVTASPTVTATPVRTATPNPTPTPGLRSAFSQIEAESFNTQSGIQTESCGEGGQNIGFIENGDYVVFNNVDFGGGATVFQARVASANSGGNIEVRLDSTSGTLVGTCSVAGTGGWQTWTTSTCSVSGASGTHNLYLRFTGGSGYLINLNWCKFTSGGVTPTPTAVRTPTPIITATPITGTPTPTAVRTATPLVTPTPVQVTPTPGTPGAIKVQFFNQSKTDSTSQLYLNIQLVNTGSSAVTLSNVKIRYWYTADGTQAQSFWCDYSPLGSSNVTGTIVKLGTAKTGADTYVEIGFSSGAGSLNAGASTQVQCRCAKSDWSNYTQSNDYSFNSSASGYVDWTKVTGYVSGALAWGAEP